MGSVIGREKAKNITNSICDECDRNLSDDEWLISVATPDVEGQNWKDVCEACLND